MIQAFKIKVSSLQSSLVQEKLFSAGYSWNTGSKDISNLKEDYLFFDKSGNITYSHNPISDRELDMGPMITFKTFMKIFDGSLAVADKNEI